MAEGERDAGSSRFASLTDDDLNQLIDDRDSKNTKNVITVSRKALNDYLKEKDGILKSVDEMDSAQRPKGRRCNDFKKILWRGEKIRWHTLCKEVVSNTSFRTSKTLLEDEERGHYQ